MLTLFSIKSCHFWTICLTKLSDISFIILIAFILLVSLPVSLHIQILYQSLKCILGIHRFFTSRPSLDELQLIRQLETVRINSFCSSLPSLQPLLAAQQNVYELDIHIKRTTLEFTRNGCLAIAAQPMERLGRPLRPELSQSLRNSSSFLRQNLWNLTWPVFKSLQICLDRE